MDIKVICFILGLASLATCYENPGQAKVAEIKQAVRNQLKQRDNKGFIATIVRLAFHDCVGAQCDGCINLNNDSNAGLAEVIQFLDDIYVGKYDQDVSRADFWQIANMAAIDQAVSLNNQNCNADDASCAIKDHSIVFKWGRDDCSTSPSTNEDHDFPGANLDRASMMGYFKRNYGFNENEVVALLGAHTLGGAGINASGYSGPWVAGETSFFNNHYYSLILNKKDFAPNGVTYNNVPMDGQSTTDKKFQFDLLDSNTNARLGFMLPTDMELAYDIDVDPLRGTQCEIGVDCSEAATISKVEEYASDNDKFMTDFSAVMQKLVEHGYEDLEQVQ